MATEEVVNRKDRYAAPPTIVQDKSLRNEAQPHTSVPLVFDIFLVKKDFSFFIGEQHFLHTRDSSIATLH
jgi:hypothetical protein